MRFLPLAYALIIFALAFFWPTLRVYKKTGINPYRLGTGDSAHDLIGRLFRVTLLGVLTLVSLYGVSPRFYNYLAPILWLEYPLLKIAGWFFLIISLIWIVLAQFNMRTSWRIGIDKENETSLIQDGLYSISRNPIFLGMRIMLLGLFLILPNALSLLLWLLGDVLMQIQVRLEENYLLEHHEAIYARYLKRVRRWM